MTNTKTLTVGGAPEGAIIETLHFGSLSGNIYKIAKRCCQVDTPDKVSAYQRFTHTRVQIAASNECRILDPNTIEF